MLKFSSWILVVQMGSFWRTSATMIWPPHSYTEVLYPFVLISKIFTHFQVDINLDRVKESEELLQPLITDYVNPKKNPLSITLLKGELCENSQNIYPFNLLLSSSLLWNTFFLLLPIFLFFFLP